MLWIPFFVTITSTYNLLYFILVYLYYFIYLYTIYFRLAYTAREQTLKSNNWDKELQFYNKTFSTKIQLILFYHLNI